VAAALLPFFTPQGLANTLWGVTTLEGRLPPPLLAAVEAEVLSRRDVAAFGAVNLNMLVWVFARSGRMGPRLARAVNAALLQLLPGAGTSNLSRCGARRAAAAGRVHDGDAPCSGGAWACGLQPRRVALHA
jgi:hypothetical protein